MPPEYHVYITPDSAADFESTLNEIKGVEIISKRTTFRDTDPSGEHAQDKLALAANNIVRELDKDTNLPDLFHLSEKCPHEWKMFRNSLKGPEKIRVTSALGALLVTAGNITLEEISQLDWDEISDKKPRYRRPGIGKGKRLQLLKGIFQNRPPSANQ